MDYCYLPEAACNMHIPVSLLKDLCERAQIEGAVRFGRVWAIPANTDLQNIRLAVVQYSYQSAAS